MHFPLGHSCRGFGWGGEFLHCHASYHSPYQFGCDFDSRFDSSFSGIDGNVQKYHPPFFMLFREVSQA
jgi:hypothetical protein